MRRKKLRAERKTCSGAYYLTVVNRSKLINVNRINTLINTIDKFCAWYKICEWSLYRKMGKIGFFSFSLSLSLFLSHFTHLRSSALLFYRNWRRRNLVLQRCSHRPAYCRRQLCKQDFHISHFLYKNQCFKIK